MKWYTTEKFKTILHIGTHYYPEETNERLPDPREWNQPRESASIPSEIDHILNHEYEISASLSELDLMFRQ